MHRYEELEKLYYKNKIKKYLIAAVLTAAIAGGGFYYYKTSIDRQVKKKIEEVNKKLKKDAQKVKKHNLEKNVQTKTDHITDKNKTIKRLKQERPHFKEVTRKKEESLTPNLSFVIPKITKDEPVKVKPKPVKVKNKQAVKENRPAEIKNQSGSIIKEESINVHQLISSFNKEPKYDTAMLISKYYFNNNDYKNAKLWALKANNINPAKFQSWKMFAMILLKKNDKIKAKEVLKIYLNDYGDNEEIYKLLRSIDE